jgi:hypothetical protein
VTLPPHRHTDSVFVVHIYHYHIAYVPSIVGVVVVIGTLAVCARIDSPFVESTSASTFLFPHYIHFQTMNYTTAEHEAHQQRGRKSMALGAPESLQNPSRSFDSPNVLPKLHGQKSQIFVEQCQEFLKTMTTCLDHFSLGRLHTEYLCARR